jgi:hypothetical protein
MISTPRLTLYAMLTISLAFWLLPGKPSLGFAFADAEPALATNLHRRLPTDDSTTRLGEAFRFVTDFVFTRHSLAFTGEQQGLRVIGAGFPRTGTKSQEAALHSLGHRIYDLRSILENRHAQRWVDAAKAWKQRGDLQPSHKLLQEMEHAGYTATLDFPMNLFALAFAELRPQAKVIFSVRDNEEKWVESWAYITKVLGHFTTRPWSWIIPRFDFAAELLLILQDFTWWAGEHQSNVDRPLPWFEILRTNPMLDSPEGRQEWIELHRRFQRELEESLPPDRLLVYNVKQGWAPLIPFLGLDDSLMEVNFPNVNDRKSIQVVRNAMDIIGAGLPLWILAILFMAYRTLGLVGFSKRTKAKTT